MGSIEIGASLRLIHNLSQGLIEPTVYTTTCPSIFIFALVCREKLTKTEYYVGHKMSCIVHHTLVR